MHIVHVIPSRLPALLYGGTERVAWWLAKEQVARGHRVTFLAEAGSECPFAEVRVLDLGAPLRGQIPAGAELVHFHYPYDDELDTPYLVTIQVNGALGTRHHPNSVFVSRDHAHRYGSETFVHNGIDPDDYGPPELDRRREYVHFLGKAAWRLKNVRGAIRIARRAGVPIRVLGGHRFNLNMGFRLTLDRNASFAGMVGGERKNEELRGSRGLIFPVLWHEPFGIAIVESLYFGCPVVGTPYGSLPELVPPEVGFLSDREDDLVEAVRDLGSFRRSDCHEWVMENFTAARMTDEYLRLYERVLAGETLNAEAPVARVARDCPLH
jgi:glycosyltransferase involved in cell wall biosynthesis